MLNLTMQQENPGSSVGLHLPIHTTGVQEALRALPPLLPSNITGLQAPHLYIVSFWLCLKKISLIWNNYTVFKAFPVLVFTNNAAKKPSNNTGLYRNVIFFFCMEDTQELLFRYWPSMAVALAKLISCVSHFQAHTQPQQVSVKDNHKHASVSWGWAR